MSSDRRRFVSVRVLALLLGALVLAGCSSQEQYRRALRDNENLRGILDDQGNQLAELRRLIDQLNAELENAKANAVSPEWRAEQERARRMLEDLRGVGAAPAGIDIVQRPEGVAFAINDGVLFSSGQAEVTDQGRATVGKIIDRLISRGSKIRVEGHTDTDPIVSSSWESNLHLSAARALAVAALLIELGVPESRVAVAGYGPFLPLDAADTAAAKSRNRRVEILVLNDS